MTAAASISTRVMMNQVMTCRFHLRGSDVSNEFIMDVATLAVPVKHHGFSSVALTVACAVLLGGVSYGTDIVPVIHSGGVSVSSVYPHHVDGLPDECLIDALRLISGYGGYHVGNVLIAAVFALAVDEFMMKLVVYRLLR